ncbi:MAG: AraC family transcriptional regulator [Fastidiosipilaceae bacterium]|jgi:AraC-like DNA-binding protein|nr:AraC family transcriptional regulator [Clostridiaceae bacterium]
MHYFIPKLDHSEKLTIGQPTLLYACKIDKKSPAYTRIIHSHSEAVEFIYILEGNGQFFIDHKPYPVHRGNLVVYNSNVIHDEFIDGQHLPILCCAATGIKIPGLPTNSILPNNTSPVIDLGPQLLIVKNLMQHIYDYAAYNQNRTSLIVHSIFEALLHIILGVTEQSTPSPLNMVSSSNHLGETAVKFIDFNFEDDISTANIADELGVSVSYLARSFKNFTGVSVVSYINRRKIGKAQTLLLTSDLSITEIAKDVGFKSLSYFTKIFSSHTGLSPSKYRKKYSDIAFNKTDLY